MIVGSVILQVKDRELWMNISHLPRLPGGMPMQRIERTSNNSVLSTIYVGMLPPDLSVLQMR
jgi:hypothetical protein